MKFLMLPPETNSASIYAGPGSEPMLNAAAAWDGLANELGCAADSFGSLTSDLASGPWQGPASVAMASAALPYTVWLSKAATRAQQAATQSNVLATEFEAVRQSMVHPLLVTANRRSIVPLILSNLFGQNFPAIAAKECEYEEMWAQDVSAMLNYHSSASAAASALQPFEQLGSLAPAAATAADVVTQAETAVQQEVALIENTVAQEAALLTAAAAAFVQEVEKDAAQAEAVIEQDAAPVEEAIVNTGRRLRNAIGLQG